MKTYAADRLRNLQESVIRSITRYAFDKGAVLLAQGFPDFDPPPEVLAAAEQAMRGGRNQYGMTWGQPGLRKAIASEDLTDALRKVHDFTTVCAPTPLQEAMAAVIGMPDAYYEWLRSYYTSRRSRMLGILDRHGFRYTDSRRGVLRHGGFPASGTRRR